MFANRPIIQVKKTIGEKMLNAFAILLYLAFLMYLISIWSSLPGQIPTHFDASGEPDAWSGKGSVWLLPTIGLVLWIGLSVLERYPHVYNYINLTKDNMEKQYKNATMMINVLKNVILIFFVFITWQSIQVANGSAEGLGEGFIFVFLGVLFGSMAIFIVRSFRL